MSKLVQTEVGLVAERDFNRWNLVCHYMSPIMDYYQNPDITEIMINRFDAIFVEGRDGMKAIDRSFGSEDALEKLITQVSITLKQDAMNLAILDARFPDQSRACCTSRTISPMGSTMTIRCAPKKTLSFDDLITYKALTQEMCHFIQASVAAHHNIIIAGGTSSGKTTLMRAMSEYIPPTDRVLICEDTQELFFNLPNQILMESPKRKATDISLSDLIKTTLRQRPDRVIVGEIRDAFACDAFLQTINTGHGGCVTSLHANSPVRAVKRIQYLLAKEGVISYELAGHEVLDSLHLLIQMKKTLHGRRVTHISTVNDDHTIVDVFQYDEKDDIHLRLAG